MQRTWLDYYAPFIVFAQVNNDNVEVRKLLAFLSECSDSISTMVTTL